MRILLTGFVPFGSLASNPSQEIVTTLADRASIAASRRFELHTAVLDTEYDRAACRIASLIEGSRPDAIVCLGVAARAEGICLERIALNLNDCELADNSGEVRLARPIVPGAPMVYLSTLPLEPMLEELRGARFSAVISNHAGTYVCNHVFYTARHKLEKLQTPIPCGFIHVPLVENARGAASHDANALTVARLADAIELSLGVVARTAG